MAWSGGGGGEYPIEKHRNHATTTHDDGTQDGILTLRRVFAPFLKRKQQNKMRGGRTDAVYLSWEAHRYKTMCRQQIKISSKNKCIQHRGRCRLERATAEMMKKTFAAKTKKKTVVGVFFEFFFLSFFKFFPPAANVSVKAFVLTQQKSTNN